jgi:hypothetical protein
MSGAISFSVFPNSHLSCQNKVCVPSPISVTTAIEKRLVEQNFRGTGVKPKVCLVQFSLAQVLLVTLHNDSSVYHIYQVLNQAGCKIAVHHKKLNSTNNRQMNR